MRRVRIKPKQKRLSSVQHTSDDCAPHNGNLNHLLLWCQHPSVEYRALQTILFENGLRDVGDVHALDSFLQNTVFVSHLCGPVTQQQHCSLERDRVTIRTSDPFHRVQELTQLLNGVRFHRPKPTNTKQERRNTASHNTEEQKLVTLSLAPAQLHTRYAGTVKNNFRCYVSHRLPRRGWTPVSVSLRNGNTSQQLFQTLLLRRNSNCQLSLAYLDRASVLLRCHFATLVAACLASTRLSRSCVHVAVMWPSAPGLRDVRNAKDRLSTNFVPTK